MAGKSGHLSHSPVSCAYAWLATALPSAASPRPTARSERGRALNDTSSVRFVAEPRPQPDRRHVAANADLQIAGGSCAAGDARILTQIADAVRSTEDDRIDFQGFPGDVGGQKPAASSRL